MPALRNPSVFNHCARSSETSQQTEVKTDVYTTFLFSVTIFAIHVEREKFFAQKEDSLGGLFCMQNVIIKDDLCPRWHDTQPALGDSIS